MNENTIKITQNKNEPEYYVRKLHEAFTMELYTRDELIELLDHMLNEDELEIDKVLFTLGMGREVLL